MNLIDLDPGRAAVEPRAESCSACQERKIAVYHLEEENAGLRRLIVELIQKNQQLREQILLDPLLNP